MRIIEIRFQNLNSLAGNWRINFNDPQFLREGLFLITGPTGAGKSTLLDAICLALYGQTPRLGKVSKSTNEIISRHQKNCYAEVTFQNSQGVFRAHWSQQRSQKQNILQSQKHELVLAGTGEVLETKLKDVQELILKITGMNFEQFTRSIMLAQGNFSAFLDANSNDRSPILEQITGTTWYSDISVFVHTYQKELREKQKILEAQCEAIQLLSDDEKIHLQESLKEMKNEEKIVCDMQEDLKDQINWLETVSKLRQTFDQLNVRLQQTADSIAQFQPERQKLDRANRATGIIREYQALESCRAEQLLDENRACKLNGELELYEKQLKLLEQEYKNSIDALDTIKSEESKISQLVKKVIELEALIAEKKKVLAVSQKQMKELSSTVQSEKCKLLQQSWSREDFEHEITKVKNDIEVFNKHNQHDSLEECKKRLEVLFDKKSKLSEFRYTYQTYQSNINEKAKLRTENGYSIKRKEELLRVNEKLIKEIDQLEEEIQTHEAEKRPIQSMRDLTVLRSQLCEGEACPLCGSNDHPFAHAEIPQIDKLVEKIQLLRISLKNKQQEQRQVEIELAKIGKSIDLFTTRHSEIEKTINTHKSKLVEILQMLATSIDEEKWNDWLNVDEKSTEGEIKKIQNQIREYEQHEKNKNVLDRFVNDLERYDRIKSSQLKYGELSSEYDKCNLEYESLSDEKRKLVGDSTAAELENNIRLRREQAEHHIEKKRQEIEQCRQKQNQIKGEIYGVQSKIHERKQSIILMNERFTEKMKHIGFNDEADFMSAVISSEEYERLKRTSENLHKEYEITEQLCKECKEKLSEELEKNKANSSVEELVSLYQSNEEKHRILQQNVGKIMHQLSQDELAKLKYDSQQAELKKHQERQRRWDLLHELIGSADGKKYRNFAQGITLDSLIDHANQQLIKMNVRYLLVRGNHELLEIDVIDQYQGGVLRSTRNLSGGERFIVSLALALGLSQMASKNVQVDSLFLDEGFGTLDEQTLMTVLDMLSELRHRGKMIGLISHVPMLRERIVTQIQITPKNGGKSVISGPGCYQE